MSASVSTATPHRPTSPSASRVVGVAAHQRRQVERGRQAVAAGARGAPGTAGSCRPPCRSRRTSASSTASSGTSTRTGPRVYGYCAGELAVVGPVHRLERDARHRREVGVAQPAAAEGRLPTGPVGPFGPFDSSPRSRPLGPAPRSRPLGPFVTADVAVTVGSLTEPSSMTAILLGRQRKCQGSAEVPEGPTELLQDGVERGLLVAGQADLAEDRLVEGARGPRRYLAPFGVMLASTLRPSRGLGTRSTTRRAPGGPPRS